MRLALRLARRGLGKTSPNPMVGAVIVKEGRSIVQGYHHHFGGDHAELDALKNAREDLSGATLYVTLEPCAHHGRTPPCADAVIAAGVGRVVVGRLDRNPKAAGGAERLRAAGIEVELLRPLVTLKLAVTLDGRVTVPGRRWVTGEESRRRVHELRAASDAVQVHGANGYSDEYPVGRFYRNAKGAVIYEGTREIHAIMQADYVMGYRLYKPTRCELPAYRKSAS